MTCNTVVVVVGQEKTGAEETAARWYRSYSETLETCLEGGSDIGRKLHGGDDLVKQKCVL